MKTTVVHLKRDEYDVYIGRPTIWGNPYSHLSNTLAEHKVANVTEAIQKYREWIQTQPHLLADLKDLKGKKLACWCRPKGGFKGKLMCHGQILAALCDEIQPEEVE